MKTLTPMGHLVHTYLTGSLIHLHGHGLTGADKPSTEQLTTSIEAGIRAVLREALDPVITEMRDYPSDSREWAYVLERLYE